MPTLQVRDVPAVVYQTLAEAARLNHRSLAQQTLATLEAGLGLSSPPNIRRRQIIEDLLREPRATGRALPDPVALIREDRER